MTPMEGHLRNDRTPLMTAHQWGAVEIDEDEGAMLLSYTLNLHLMQLPGTFLKKNKVSWSLTPSELRLMSRLE